MAHKKAAGSTSNGRDSQSQRLGIKIQDGQYAGPGCIIVRQRGTKFYPGTNVGRGNDDTLFSKITGLVRFSSKKMKKFNNCLKDVKIVSVVTK